MEYWVEFDMLRILTAFMKLAFYHGWDYPVRKEEEDEVER